MRIGNPGVAIDTAAEENGKWFDAPAEWGGISVCVASAFSVQYQAATEASKLRDEKDPSRREAIVADLVASKLIRGWRGLRDVNGSDIPYSTDAAVAICRNRDNRRFLMWVMDVAAGTRSFDAEVAAVAEAAEKN